MNPFDLIEKWINEHGSAAILRDRIELAKDQYTVVVRERTEAISRAESADGRVKILEAENEQLRVEIENLNAALNSKPIVSHTKFEPRLR